jgi:hypothetical protein
MALAGLSRRRAERTAEEKAPVRRHLTEFLLFAVSLVCARPAVAQTDRAIGVTMAYPASVGLLWRASENFALRPELSFVHTSTEQDASLPTGGVELSGSGTSLSVGISALFYLAKWDMLRAYVVPRYAYSRSTSESEGPFTGRDLEIRTTGHTGGVSFGAEHALGERFAIFGELGLAYERATTEVTTELRRRSFGTHSGVGVVFFFF